MIVMWCDWWFALIFTSRFSRLNIPKWLIIPIPNGPMLFASQCQQEEQPRVGAFLDRHKQWWQAAPFPGQRPILGQPRTWATPSLWARPSAAQTIRLPNGLLPGNWSWTRFLISKVVQTQQFLGGRYVYQPSPIESHHHNHHHQHYHGNYPNHYPMREGGNPKTATITSLGSTGMPMGQRKQQADQGFYWLKGKIPLLRFSAKSGRHLRVSKPCWRGHLLR